MSYDPEIKAAAVSRYLAGESSPAIAADIGCTSPTVLKWVRSAGGRVRFRPGDLEIDWSAQPLGDVPDADLAGRLGCSQTAVFRARRRRGISPCGIVGAEDWDTVSDLGQVSDTVIARRVGVTRQAVHDARLRRAIPSARDRRRAATAVLIIARSHGYPVAGWVACDLPAHWGVTR